MKYILVIFLFHFELLFVQFVYASEKSYLEVGEIVPNATTTDYEYYHGQLVHFETSSNCGPTQTPCTHPGIDIAAPLRSSIHAWADGHVVDVVDESHPDWREPELHDGKKIGKGPGYAIRLSHQESILGKETYTLYLHLNERPSLEIGKTVDKGEIIGRIGQTGFATGPHVHFEIRHFTELGISGGTIYSTWGNRQAGNIYGFEDYHNDPYFLEKWTDPENVILAKTQHKVSNNSTSSVANTPSELQSKELLNRIEKALSLLPKPSDYLYETTSIQGQIVGTWTELTAGILGTRGLRVAYDNFYFSSLEYAALTEISLIRARRVALNNDLDYGHRLLANAQRYEKQFRLNQEAANKVYLDGINTAAVLAKGIYDGSKAAVIYGSKMVIGPTGSLLVDTVFDVTDFFIEATDNGFSSATRKLVSEKLTEMIFSNVPLASLNGRTLEEAIESGTVKAVGASAVNKYVLEAVSNPKFAKEFMGFITKSGSYIISDLTEDQVTKIIAYILQESKEVPPLTVCGQNLPVNTLLQVNELRQAILGGYSFDPACQTHDICYGDCVTLKKDCDKELLSLAKSVCESAKSIANSAMCYSEAYAFFSAVHFLGENSFKAERASCPSSQSGIAVALIIDRSGSMIGLKSGPSGTAVSSGNDSDKKKLEKAKEAAKAFILSREENDMASLTVFSDSANTIQGISAVKAIKPQIDGILGKINASGATNIGAGLEQGFMQLSNIGDTYTKMAVLLSDGENNRGEWRTKVDKFKQKGWPVCTVGFGSDADETILRAIAKNTGCIYEFSDITNIVNSFQGINAYASGESTILQTNDALPPQGSISYPFYVTALAKMLKIYTSWQGSTLNIVLTTPEGRKIDKQHVVQGSGRYEEGDTFQMLELENPPLGKWTIEADWAVPPLVTERVNLMITEKTGVFVRIHGFRPHYSISQPVAINVDAQELVGSGRRVPLTNLKLAIQVQKPGPDMIRMVKARSSNWTMYKDVMLDITRDIALFDDGNHDDYKVGDGIYGGTFTETDKNGAYLVTVDIKGQKQDGGSIEKTLIGVFQVGAIANNQVSTGQTLQYREQAKTHINNSTPFSNEIVQQPLDEIDKLQTDPMDSIEKLMNE